MDVNERSDTVSDEIEAQKRPGRVRLYRYVCECVLVLLFVGTNIMYTFQMIPRDVWWVVAVTTPILVAFWLVPHLVPDRRK